MKVFLQKYGEDVTGVLCGFDRLVFRGTLRRLVYQEGMMGFLYAAQVLLKDFGRYVLSVSSRLKEASLELARQNSRPVEYLASSQISKEDVARKIAARDGITEGLVCVLTCVEPCRSFEIFKNRETKHLHQGGEGRRRLSQRIRGEGQTGYFHKADERWSVGRGGA